MVGPFHLNQLAENLCNKNVDVQTSWHGNSIPFIYFAHSEWLLKMSANHSAYKRPTDKC